MTRPASTPVVVGSPLQLSDISRVARCGCTAVLDRHARAGLAQTRSQLEQQLANGATIYGVNTGFGALHETRIPHDKLATLQLNLLRSHAVGVGTPLARDVVRALLLLRSHTLALGASGVSPELAEHLVKVLNAGITPRVPCQGSVGASGDLAPLAHLALVLVGEGFAATPSSECTYIDGARALAEAGIDPFTLGPKEGLSLINGTQVMTAIGALALTDAAELIAACDIIGALSLDTHLGTVSACDPRIHAGKAHPGQLASASLIRDLIAGSPLNASHRDCKVVQDAYSMRCMPQVHGAVRGAFAYASQACEIEVNSFTDNPLVLPRDPDSAEAGFDVLSGGNFHGATIAVPLDHMTAALTTLATISERRSDRFMNHNSSRGLPAFLADHPGVQSG
ncbi:MAG: HAL/PAL/TAL family ammonia-lyase, partial [Nannocystaceae bacterium]